MITRRDALLGMSAAVTAMAAGLPTTAQADELARIMAQRDFEQREYAGWDNATLRDEIFAVDYSRWLAHASLHRDYLAVSWALSRGDAERIAHYHAQAAQRIGQVVAPANAAWHARGIPMVRELARRGEKASFPAYTLEDRASYRDFIHAYDDMIEAGTSDELARVVALHKIGHSWTEASEMVFDEEAIAVMVGRTLEARQMRRDRGNVS